MHAGIFCVYDLLEAAILEFEFFQILKVVGLREILMIAVA